MGRPDFVPPSLRQRLRSSRRRSLLAKMPAPKAKKSRVKGVASRGFFRRRKWIWIPVVVLLLIPAMQVALVRFIMPPTTLPMLLEQISATFSRGPKHPLLYRWRALLQIPEMFLEHLWGWDALRFYEHV